MTEDQTRNLIRARFRLGRLGPSSHSGWIQSPANYGRQRRGTDVTVGSKTNSEGRGGGVADGTRTRNNQNHNLGIYH